jgi:hypothetical protein
MTTTFTREMFSIIVDGHYAEIKIWRRPDLDSAAGARNAQEMATESAKLPARGVREILFDVREAPAVAGPKSTAVLAELLRGWGMARVRIAVLISDDAVKTLQFRRLVVEHAPKNAFVTSDPHEAARWLVPRPAGT